MTNTFHRRGLFFPVVFIGFLMLFISACSTGQDAPVPPKIETSSTVNYGDVNPVVTVTGNHFSSDIVAADLSMTAGSTGLTLNTVNYINSSEINISFTGTAQPGNMTIQARTSAYNPPTALESNTLTIPAMLQIGDSYQGGTVAYVLQSGDPSYVEGEQHGIIVAPSNLGPLVWYTACSGTTGATATALGTGNDNTNTIVSVYGSDNNAAKACYDSSSGGYTDWFLPSNDELLKLRDMVLTYGYTPGGFGSSDEFYWSSSEINDECAYFWEVSMTGLGSMGKCAPIVYARCIRSF